MLRFQLGQHAPHGQLMCGVRVGVQEAHRDRFDAWLKGYFERNAFRPMTTERFLEDIRTHLVTTRALEDQLMMDAWIYQPGMPSNWRPPVSTAFVPVDAAGRGHRVDVRLAVVGAGLVVALALATPALRRA